MALALAALALPGCSSDDLKPGSDPDNGGASGTTTGNAYINVSLTLPTENSSSRAENDNFDDGETSEYAVFNSMLVLFKGTSEETATVVDAYNLNLAWNTDAKNQNITSQGIQVQELDGIQDDGVDYNNYWVLAILNHSGLVSVDIFKTDKGSPNWGMKGMTLSEIASATASKEAYTILDQSSKNGIFMTNAVLTNKKGTFNDGTPHILVNLKGQVYTTKAEASSKPATEIVVERGFAKVQVSDNMTTNSLTINGVEFVTKIVGWKLTNTSKCAYMIRNWPISSDKFDNTWLTLTSSATNSYITANPYRFAGIKEVQIANQNLLTLTEPIYYRTYWGIDPTYNLKTADSDAVEGLITNTDKCNLNEGDYTYCLENTFDVEHQNVKNTTAAVIKVQLTKKDGEAATFYTIDGFRNVVYDKENITKYVASNLETYVGIENAFKRIYGYDGSQTYSNIRVKTVTLSSGEGATDVLGITLTWDEANGEERYITGEDLAEVQSHMQINTYLDGCAYYTVLIKHFGDELTPWNEGESTPAPSIGTDMSKAYPDFSAANYLGRYGVLRNNWYNISVTSVLSLGEASDPSGNLSTDPTPDDNLSAWIACKINILSWAKRTQGVDLQ